METLHAMFKAAMIVLAGGAAVCVAGFGALTGLTLFAFLLAFA